MLAQIILFDGFDPLDALAPYEALHAGSTISGGRLAVELVSAEGTREVPSGTPAVSLRASARLDPWRADLIVVPGAAGAVEEDEAANSVHNALQSALRTELPTLLKQAVDRPELTVTTVCGGSMLLAMAGLIAGRHATTHHLGLDALEAMGIASVPARVVDDGNLVTSAGITSGLDLSLHLLERELGPRIAHATEALLAFERRGTVWRAQGPVPVAV